MTGMKICTSKSEANVLSQKRVDCPLLVWEEVLPKVEEYCGVFFRREGKMKWKIGRHIRVEASVRH